MSENRISIKFSEADTTAINAAIQTIVTKTRPYLIALSAEDKKSLPKVADKSIPFIQKGLQYMETNPEFTPLYLDKTEVGKDFNASGDINGFLRLLLPLVSNMEDTSFLCGAEAYQGVLNYYNNVKQAMKTNIPNAKAIYDDLSTYFDAQKVKPQTPQQ